MVYPIPRNEIISIVRRGIETRHPPELPFEIKSGTSWSYADIKHAVSDGIVMRLVASYAVSEVLRQRVDFNVVGGPTMGADFFANSIAMAGNYRCFTVAKPGKPEALYDANGQQVLGTRFMPGDRLLAVEDTVSTGGSLFEAVDLINEHCRNENIEDVEVVAAATILDRGDKAAKIFAGQGIAYVALTTYRDFGLEPVS